MILVSKRHRKKVLELAEKYNFPPSDFVTTHDKSDYVFLFKGNPYSCYQTQRLWVWFPLDFPGLKKPKLTPIKDVEALIQLNLL